MQNDEALTKNETASEKINNGMRIFNGANKYIKIKSYGMNFFKQS